jgi:hypothetical protein
MKVTVRSVRDWQRASTAWSTNRPVSETASSRTPICWAIVTSRGTTTGGSGSGSGIAASRSRASARRRDSNCSPATVGRSDSRGSRRMARLPSRSPRARAASRIARYSTRRRRSASSSGSASPAAAGGGSSPGSRRRDLSSISCAAMTTNSDRFATSTGCRARCSTYASATCASGMVSTSSWRDSMRCSSSCSGPEKTSRCSAKSAGPIGTGTAASASTGIGCIGRVPIAA